MCGGREPLDGVLCRVRVSAVSFRRMSGSSLEEKPTSKRVLGGNLVLTLDQASPILSRRDVLQRDIVGERTEEGASGANQYWHAGDHESLDAPGAEEALNRDAAIHVRVANPPGIKLDHNVGWFPGHALYDRTVRHPRKGASAEYKDRLLSVRPLGKGQNRFISVATNHQCIHAGEELLVTVRFTASGWEKVERAIGPGEVAVEARAHKDGCFHIMLAGCRLGGARIT